MVLALLARPGSLPSLAGGFLSLAALACAVGICPVAPVVAGPAEDPMLTSVVVDIRPGLCPNDLRVESPLTVPVAILGTMSFEVANIDPGTVRLSRAGVAGQVEPVGWAYKDVGIPLVGGRCACHELRGDGLDDLELYFRIADLTATLGLGGHIGETVPLVLSGALMTGEGIEGIDCATVISGPWQGEESGDDIWILAHARDEAAAGGFRFSYCTAVSDRVTFAIYDVTGRMVARLIDMDMAPGIYHTMWNATDHNSLKVPPGTYFARVSNSWASDTRKIMVLQ